MMLWHAIFDFTIPLWNFIRHLNRSDTWETRRILLHSTEIFTFNDLLPVFSEQPLIWLHQSSPLLLTRGTLGIEKLESDVSETRPYEDSITFPYEFNRTTALGMREQFMKVHRLDAAAVGLDGKPLAILIDRGHNSRNIENNAEIEEAMREGCPHCNVRSVALHNLGFRDQVQLVSKASVLVGLHGSGLTNVIWMAESRENHTTHLVEIMPFKYLCRPWYQTAAGCAGVEYHMVMNRNETEGVTDEELVWCWGHPEKCPILGCHDRLRDQKTRLEIETFKETWLEIAENLKTTMVVEGKHRRVKRSECFV
jgi:hypothetical protein